MEGESLRAALEGKAKTVISAKDIPDPTVDIAQTKGWTSIANASTLDLGTIVTHRNLQTLASMMQAMSGMLVDQNKKLTKLTGDVAVVQDVLGVGGSGNTSRRSSMGSVGRRSSAGETTADEGQVTSFDNIMGKLEFLDDFFEGFIQDNPSCKPLVKRTKNTEASGIAFVNAAKDGLGEALENENAAIINGYLADLNGSEMADVFVALSKRFRSNQTSGKKVATVTQSFETNVADDNDGSQSTQANTPRRSTRARPIPKTPHRRQDVVRDSDDDDAEGTEANDDTGGTEANDDTGGLFVSDDDDTFQP